jgi:DNA-binding CsgD family transcriptional regulator
MNAPPSILLRADELERIGRLQRGFLGLPHAATRSAVRSALTATRRLVGSDGAFALYFFDGAPVFVADGLDEQLETYLFRQWRGFDEDGFLLFDDPELEAVNRLRRSLGAGVHHESRLADREALRNTAFYREGFAPAGMTCATGMTAPLPVGEAIFAFNLPEAERAALEERAGALLALLLPAFETGFTQLYERSIDAAGLAPSLQALPFPAAIVAADGRVVFENEHARRAPERLRRDRHPGGGVYRMPGPVLDGNRASTILLAPAEEPVLDLRLAARVLRLTPRQAEVARLMLQGLSDKDIARSLGISLHTARRHAETVLDRSGVSSRAGVLLALLEATGYRLA